MLCGRGAPQVLQLTSLLAALCLRGGGALSVDLIGRVDFSAAPIPNSSRATRLPADLPDKQYQQSSTQRYNIYEDDGVNEKADWLPQRGPRGDVKGWTDRLLLWPEKKFAFCWIDKNAGSQFNLMMNKLNGLKKGVWWVSDMHELNAWWLWKHKEPLNISVSREDGWRFGIFLRDPAERFLSAWLSKCQNWEDAGKNCLGKFRVPTEPISQGVETFEEVVQNYLPEYMERLSRVHFHNAHYDPQSAFCGGVHLSSFDFVGRLSEDFSSVRQQVFLMMRDVAKVPENNTEAWDRISELFPDRDASNVRITTSRLMHEFYRKEETYHAVQEAYRQDYESLGLDKLEFGEFRRSR